MAIENKYFAETDITKANDFENQLLKFQEELGPVMKKTLEKIAELNQ